MKEIQEFMVKFHKEMNWEIANESYNETRSSLLNNFMLLTTEVSEIAEEFRAIFNRTYKLVNEQNLSEEKAFEIAKELHKENLGNEISDCIAYLIKFSNYLEIDMESSFYNKMNEVRLRINKDQRS